ncbi:LuxR C-terminal-related transcriptional regulator [Alloalcanivorax gelatiniphagus]
MDEVHRVPGLGSPGPSASESRFGPLMAAKTSVPPAHPGIVARPRLWARLDALAQSSVLVMTAPTGSGKSQLVASWVRERDWPTAWLSLESSDRDPYRFWTGIILALRRIFDDEGPAALSTLEPAPSQDHALTVLPALVLDALSEVGQPILIVLDDVHEIDGGPAADALAYFLLHLPPHVRVLLCGVFLPALPKARLRSEGRLTSVDSAELGFTADEAESLLQHTGLNLTREQTADLVRRTEGWSAGLRLAALSAPRQAAPRTPTLVSVETDEYLVAEVLSGLPEHIRTFLLKTCVCERLTGPLADALTGNTDGVATLTWLAERNVFTERLSDGQWFRYHSLFVAMLQRQRDVVATEALTLLHDRAANWLARHGMPVEAFAHACHGSSPDLARDILHSAWLTLYLRGEQQTLRDMVDRALAAADDASAPALLRIRRVASLASDEPGSDVTLTRFSDIAESEDDLAALVLSLEHGRARGDLPAVRIAAARLLDQRSGGPGDGESYSDLAALALYELGVVEYWNDDRFNAGTHLRGALKAARERELTFISVACLSQLVGVMTAEDRLHDAQAMAAEAMAIASSHGWEQTAVVADLWHALGWIHYLRDDLEAADQFLDLADDAVRCDDTAVRAAARLVRGLVLSQRGQKRAALNILRGVEKDLENLDASFVFVDYVSAEVARLHTVLGQAAMARALLGPRRRAGESLHLAVARAELLLSDGLPEAAMQVLSEALVDGVGFLDQRIQAKALLSILELQHRGMRSAIPTFRGAVELAAPEGMLQPLLQFGARVDRLLEAVLRDGSCDAAFVRDVRRHVAAQASDRTHVTTFAGDAIKATAGLDEPLTPREEEILARLAGRETLPELAADLYLSINTVKVHLRSLYRKMQVHSRRDAVAKAESLGLL